MSGGVGSRFWPFSKEGKPKQFLDFFGTGRSLLQTTFDRFKKIVPAENIFVVTNDAYAEMTKKTTPGVERESNSAGAYKTKYCTCYCLRFIQDQVGGS